MKTTILYAFVVFTVSTQAQTIISGTVTDTNGEPLALANVAIDASYDGGSSDHRGNFEFSTTQVGRRTLVISYTGFEQHRDEIELNGQALSFLIILEEAVQSIDAVTITAGTFSAGDQSSKTMFRALDIATTAGATADIAGAMNTLPGTQKVGESGRLFIRGGDGSETQTFIDGLIVPAAYGPAAPNTPSRGRFLPFMFKGMSFSTGGYSAEYGNALSSVLVLESKDKAETTRSDLGILSVGADAAHTRVWNKGSMTAKMSYTDLQPYFSLVDQRIDWRNPPVGKEAHLAFRQQSGKHGMLKVYGNYSTARFSLNDDLRDGGKLSPFALFNRYKYLNGTYRNILNENWLVKSGIAYGETDTEISSQTDIREYERTMHAKTTVEGSLSKTVELKTGAEFINRRYAYAEKDTGALHFNEGITSLFVEADVQISEHFIARSGARIEHNNLRNEMSVNPRLSFAYKTGSQSQLSFAFGRFIQTPENRYTRTRQALLPQAATHFILNFQWTEDDRTFRAEAYYKQYANLIKFKGGNEHAPDNSGYGYARGVELFWRDNQTLKNSDYWISYSFLDTRRNYLHFPEKAVPTFASRHNLSLVFKHFFRSLKSQLGSTASYTSGRPYDDPNVGTFNDGITRSYQDLSLNWSFLPSPSLIIYLSCTNLLGRDNIFGYEFGDKPNEDGLYPSRPTRLPARRFLFAAIFITLSKEKTVNQLPDL